MVLVKHKDHGNKHVNEAEVAALLPKGWVVWPRPDEQKIPKAKKAESKHVV